MDGSALEIGLRWGARLLGTTWLGFWTWFVVAVIVAEGPPPPPIFMAVGGIVLLCSATLALAWAREGLGGAGLMLIGVGLLLLTGFTFHRQPFVLATLPLPVLLAGALFLLHRWFFSTAP